jgi:hypothetical protein
MLQLTVELELFSDRAYSDFVVGLARDVELTILRRIGAGGGEPDGDDEELEEELTTTILRLRAGGVSTPEMNDSGARRFVGDGEPADEDDEDLFTILIFVGRFDVDVPVLLEGGTEDSSDGVGDREVFKMILVFFRGCSATSETKSSELEVKGRELSGLLSLLDRPGSFSLMMRELPEELLLEGRSPGRVEPGRTISPLRFRFWRLMSPAKMSNEMWG